MSQHVLQANVARSMRILTVFVCLSATPLIHSTASAAAIPDSKNLPATITPVPEPSYLFIVLLPVILGIWRRRRVKDH